MLGGALYLQKQNEKKEEATYTLSGKMQDLPKLKITEEDTKKVDRIVVSKAGSDAGPPSEVVLDKKDDKCDACGGALFQRDDDKEETVRHRLEVYQEQTAPIISYYADEGILVGVDATGPVEEVTQRAMDAIRPFMG